MKSLLDLLRVREVTGWVPVITRAMMASGRGYRQHSLRNTGRGGDRRGDKVDAAANGVPPAMRRYQRRYG